MFARNYNGVVAAAPLIAAHHPQPAAVAYTQPIFSSDAATYSSYTAYPHVAAYQAYAPYQYAAAVGAPLKYVAAAGAPVLL